MLKWKNTYPDTLCWYEATDLLGVEFTVSLSYNGEYWLARVGPILDGHLIKFNTEEAAKAYCEREALT